MKELTIHIPDEVYHRLEVQAAKDDQRIAEGVARLLAFLVAGFEGKNKRG